MVGKGKIVSAHAVKAYGGGDV